MTTESRTHNDYTVGWVCALPKEQTAATAMLDQRHADLPKPPNDHNTYTLGSIGKHNIVIACLPKGKIGTTPATTVALQMISTFSSIKFGLMVGIGGGIPPKVRLGDVVVSVPVDRHPGVVQWDLGRTEQGHKFERTGALNNPPTLLLTALTKVETEHELTGSRIPDYLEELKEKWPRLVSKYLRSDSLEDILFKADYDHVSGNDEEGEEEEEGEEGESCRYCDKTKVVKMKPRDMRVHYGLIASGNSVIKDSTFRDKLRRDLDGAVLCVEMEAAGLMDNFPCIVIRGICDYADSHKNKAWQEHAAAVAAAFAKELLGYVPFDGVAQERSVKDVVGRVYEKVKEIKGEVVQVRSRLRRQEDLEVLEWLTPIDYGLQQTDYLRRRQPGTGEWLLDSENYHNWIKGLNQKLFLPGIPGAGKTILTSIVVDDLDQKFNTEISAGTIGIAYIYCNFKRKHEQKIEDLISSLLKQFLQSRPSLPLDVRDLYDDHIRKRTRPTLHRLLVILKAVIATHVKTFIIIDALDECQTSDDCRKRLLSEIFNLQKEAKANILATSRFIPEVTETFEGSIISEVRASKDGLHKYLGGRMSQLPQCVDRRPDLQNEITTTITEAVDGMFLLAQLHFESLAGKDTPKSLRKALQSLATGSNSYDIAYEGAMKRIGGQLQEQEKRAQQVISWITCVRRSLTKWELQHALAVETGELKLDEENLPEIESLISICAGLVTIDEESSIIRLVHHTAQEYFERTQGQWFPNIHLDLAAVCTTYLSFQDFADGYCQTDDEFEQRLKLHVFYEYAAGNWGHHARIVSTCTNDVPLLREKILPFLQKKAHVEASSQALMIADHNTRNRQSGYSQLFPTQMTSFHLVAYLGLHEIVPAIRDECNMNGRDGHGRTPLSLAATRGHEAVVQLLLTDERVDPDPKDKNGLTPLSAAAKEGHATVVQLLLTDERIDPNSKDEDGRTPLSHATVEEHATIVRLLLADKRTDPDLTGIFLTPLMRAANYGVESIVQLLLTDGRADPNQQDEDHRTPLFLAASKKSGMAVQVLLADRRTDPNLKDDHGWTPLLVAARQKYEYIVQLLLADERVDPDPRNDDGGTPLSWAAWLGLVTIVELLLSTNRVNPDSKDTGGGTPLLYAAWSGNDAIVRLLLASKQVNPDSKDNYGETPLSRAAMGKHEAVVELLLATGRVDTDCLS